MAERAVCRRVARCFSAAFFFVISREFRRKPKMVGLIVTLDRGLQNCFLRRASPFRFLRRACRLVPAGFLLRRDGQSTCRFPPCAGAAWDRRDAFLRLLRGSAGRRDSFWRRESSARGRWWWRRACPPYSSLLD